MQQKRTAFYVSDGTGLTAETLGHSLLTQFPDVQFKRVTIPFIDNAEKAEEAVKQIDHTANEDGGRPIVFSTVVAEDLREIVNRAHALVIDILESYVAPMEEVLGTKATRAVGRSHGQIDTESYRCRIDAVNYAVHNDDGITTKQYSEADIILVGVSRSGKTPLCLYLAMQYGIYAANYPLTEDDLDDLKLPAALEKHRARLFGLTIDAQRLHEIREQRRPNSRYSSLNQCQIEIRQINALYRKERMPFLDSTQHSIEEMASTLLQITGIQRRL